MIDRISARRAVMLCGAALLALSAHRPAVAQENPEELGTPGDALDAQAPADGEEEIVVTGFRAALATAVQTKRRADQIVESISAEDIGKLPDNSIAESIARLPGVTAQRLDGRDQVISVRGLSPDFATTLLNGREQVTTGDNRGVEFDQYPSELIGGVDVYKTPQAGLIGQGLSGTINLKTIRPLGYGRRALGVSARAETVDNGKLNTGSEDVGYRLSGTYIDQFADGTIGVMLGVAHMSSPSQIERFNAWGYPTIDTAGTLAIGGAKPYVQSNDLTRTGAIGSIEWEPNDNLNMRLDGYYSHFEDRQILRGIEFPLIWGGRPLEPGFTVEDGLVTDGTFAGVKAVVRNDYNSRDADLYSVGWNAEYTNDAWTFVGDVSYSRVDRKDVILETNAGTSRGAANGPFDTVNISRNEDGYFQIRPTLNYADPSLIFLTSAQGWGGDVIPGGQDGYLNSPSTKDEITAFRASAAYDFEGGIDSVEVGANYTMRRKSYMPDDYYLQLAANAADPTHSTSVAIPSNLLLDPTALDYLGIPGMISYDPLALIDSGIYNLVHNPNADVAIKGWDLDEDVVTGWVRANIDQPVGGGTLTGNVGVQVVHTDQSSSGVAAYQVPGVGGVTQPLTDGIKYTEILPSMNLSFRFDDSNVLRFGVARTLARARMDQMRSTFNYTFNDALYNSPDPAFGSYFGGTGGNPRLKPWIADSVDLSFEHYFGAEAYLAAAGFYKYLETYIYDQTTIFDFTGFQYTPPVGAPATPGTFLGNVTQPANGSGGRIYGVELSGALPLSLFTSALDGFGVLGSYSYTESTIQPDPNNPATTIPGLSKHVANATAYFEKDGFSARTSLRYRSSFRAEVVGFGGAPVNRTAKGEMVVDAQVGYEFQSGALDGLGILLQGQNLTNEPFMTYEQGDERLVIDHQSYGRRFLLGLSYKF